MPPVAKECTKADLPWFEYYSDGKAPEGSEKLINLKSVANPGSEKKDVPLPEIEPLNPGNVVKIIRGISKEQVREGDL